MSALSSLATTIDPQFQQSLPGEERPAWHPKQTPGLCWHHCPPTAVSQPKMIAYFNEVVETLGLKGKSLEDPEVVKWLAGNQTLENFMPYSSCYGGHQFGHWAGQLGDGRAITIGEFLINNKRLECQLKGAGPTPYSRTADGRAVLRSSIREFLCSEAMHHLGVPTTRALSLVETGEDVVRDILYSGNPQAELGAIVCRVAPSFIRFGHFEILAARKETHLLQQFLDFTIQRDFPDINSTEQTQEQKYAQFFIEVCRSTALMITHWQRVGFVHGVMNTDNMSILGLTIDYGPYGWLDNFDRQWTPNTTDAQGKRYRFGHQPAIARWNLICLANALAAIISDLDILKTGIEMFDLTINDAMYSMQCEKFGLSKEQQWIEQNGETIDSAYNMLEENNIDFTLFFRFLTEHDNQSVSIKELKSFSYNSSDETLNIFNAWLEKYYQLVTQQPLQKQQRIEQMNKANPCFILRNYLAQVAIETAESGDYEELHSLMESLRNPYYYDKKKEAHYSKRPDWALDKVGCSMLSCSS